MKSGNVNCQVVDFLVDLAGVTELAIASSGGTGYTYTVPTEIGVSYAFEYQMYSAGTVAVKAELQQANSLPATQAAASDWFAVPEDAAAFDDSIVDASRHIKAYAPAATAYMRVKFTGLSGNAASTVAKVARVSAIRGS